MTDRDDRLGYAESALAALFPGDAARATSDPRRRFAVLPSRRHPRLLVPLSPPGGAAAALRAYGGRLSSRDRLAYGALAAALGVTSSRALRPAYSAPEASAGIDEHLGTMLGTTVAAAVHLTPARANRKPIVQALAAGERYPVGFAKIGADQLTDALVRTETAALRRIAAARLDTVVVPEVAGDLPWQGHSTLVMRPLPTWSGGRPPTPQELATASAEVRSLGDTGSVTLRDSAFWSRLCADADAVAPADARDRLRATVDRVDRAFGDREITVGGAHGDWSPWNMWRTRDGLLVWDWERFTLDSPAGTDLVHYRLQQRLVAGAAPPDAARDAVNATQDELTGVLHLLTLAVRYDKDRAPVRPTADWLLPVVDAAAARPNATTGGAR
jgi:hypothetical protein